LDDSAVSSYPEASEGVGGEVCYLVVGEGVGVVWVVLEGGEFIAIVSDEPVGGTEPDNTKFIL